MGKILTNITTLIVIGIIFISCSDNNSGSSVDSSSENLEIVKIEVAATIFPIYDITRQIAGENIEVYLLIAPGESPHTFNPTPSTKKEIEHSEIIFAIGHGIDNFVTDISSNEEKIITVDTDLTLIKYDDEHHDHKDHDHDKHDDKKHGDEKHADEKRDDHDGHGHGEYNPHYWLDPMNAKVVAVTIADALAQLDPANAESYNSRSSAFIEEIDTLHTELIELSELAHGKSFITFHDSMTYLTKRYNLSYVGSFEPTGAEEPTPQYLQELTKIVESDNVRAIFSEPQLSSEALDPFIKDNNLAIAILDPIGGIGERDSYQKLIYYNVKTIVNVLNDK